MNTEFSDAIEEESPKRKLETCQAHGLKYDPAITWGCVLCKKQQKKRISATLVVGGILILVAVGFLIIPPIYAKMVARKPQPHRVIHVPTPTPTGDTDEDVNAAPRKCLMGISSTIEKCIAQLSDDDEHQIDRELCLDPLDDLDTRCPGAWTPELCIEGPLYAMGALPDWKAISNILGANQQVFENCLQNRIYRFALRLAIDATSGKPHTLTASAFGLDASERLCVSQKLNALTFPTSTEKETYAFTMFVDSKVLADQRPAQDDPAQKAYEQFAREQRLQAEQAERREQQRAKTKEREAELKASQTQRDE